MPTSHSIAAQETFHIITNVKKQQQKKKTVVLLNIFVETEMHFFKVQKKSIYLEIFCNIINIFNVTFDQFIESLWNKSINLFKKKNKRFKYKQ